MEMSRAQLDEILAMSAQNPPPLHSSPEMMRSWIEDVCSHLPVAETVEVRSVNCGPCEADFIVPDGGDASRIIIFCHGGGFFFFFRENPSRHHNPSCARIGLRRSRPGLSF